MEHFANTLAFSYNGMMLIPKWLLYVITGAFGSFIISFLHRSDAPTPKPRSKPEAKAEAKPAAAKIEAAPEASEAAASPSPSPKKKGGAKKRQGKKASI